jgi:hypothetical protein
VRPIPATFRIDGRCFAVAANLREITRLRLGPGAKQILSQSSRATEGHPDPGEAFHVEQFGIGVEIGTESKRGSKWRWFHVEQSLPRDLARHSFQDESALADTT